jgi:hypothetical protein
MFSYFLFTIELNYNLPGCNCNIIKKCCISKTVSTFFCFTLFFYSGGSITVFMLNDVHVHPLKLSRKILKDAHEHLIAVRR